MPFAERHQADTAGLVLLSGYYVWTAPPNVLLVAAGALRVIGDAAFTISPLLGWLQMPLLKWQMFSPARVPARFRAEYSRAMALRPSQIRATSIDGVLMIPAALALRGEYKNLTLPVTIIAGEGDRVVFKRRSEQLQDRIRGSVLQIVKGPGTCPSPRARAGRAGSRARGRKQRGSQGPATRLTPSVSSGPRVGPSEIARRLAVSLTSVFRVLTAAAARRARAGTRWSRHCSPITARSVFASSAAIRLPSRLSAVRQCPSTRLPSSDG